MHAFLSFSACLFRHALSELFWKDFDLILGSFSALRHIIFGIAFRYDFRHAFVVVGGGDTVVMGEVGGGWGGEVKVTFLMRSGAGA
jgi:hypothetical protein